MRPIRKDIFIFVAVLLFVALFCTFHFLHIHPLGMLIVTPIYGITAGHMYRLLRGIRYGE